MNLVRSRGRKSREHRALPIEGSLASSTTSVVLSPSSRPHHQTPAHSMRSTLVALDANAMAGPSDLLADEARKMMSAVEE